MIQKLAERYHNVYKLPTSLGPPEPKEAEIKAFLSLPCDLLYVAQI